MRVRLRFNHVLNTWQRQFKPGPAWQSIPVDIARGEVDDGGAEIET